MAQCPSRFSLVQWKCSDLSEAENQALGEHVARCAACQQKVKQLNLNIERYQPKQQAYGAQLVLRLTEEKAPQTVYSKWRWWALAFGGVAVTAVIAIALVDPRARFTPISQSTAVRFKGTVAIQAVVKRGENQFAVEPNATLLSDDALRFVVTTSSGGYLSVFSIDSKRHVAFFYPDSDPVSDPQPMRIYGAGRHELSGSIVLDEAIGAECIVAAFSEKPFDRKAIHERARRSAWFGESRAPRSGESDANVALSVIWITKSR